MFFFRRARASFSSSVSAYLSFGSAAPPSSSAGPRYWRLVSMRLTMGFHFASGFSPDLTGSTTESAISLPSGSV